VTAIFDFVISYVKKYQGHGLDLSELVAIGNEGLLKAVRKFDPDQGVKFISYAVWWCARQCSSAGGSRRGSVRIPLNQNSRSSACRARRPCSRRCSSATRLPKSWGRLLEKRRMPCGHSKSVSTTEVSLDAPVDRSNREASTFGERFAGTDATKSRT